MSPAAIVGIDIGTSSAKGIAVDPASGSVLAVAESEYPVNSPQVGWMEQPPEAWVVAARDVLARLRTDCRPVQKWCRLERPVRAS